MPRNRKTAKTREKANSENRPRNSRKKIDAEGRKIINDLLVADKERTVWPENTEPKFTGKKGTKLIKVAFDTKIKKYTHAHEGKEVQVEEPIRLDIPDSHIYFSFHPTKNEYIMIDMSNRREPDAKYVVTAPKRHWI